MEEITPQLSVAVGLKVTVAKQDPGAVTNTKLGQVRTGLVRSCTVTVEEQAAVFPPTSVTEKEIAEVPLGNVDPLVRPPVCIKVPPQLSEKEAENDTTAVQTPGAVGTVTAAGQVILGGTASTTVIRALHVAEPPEFETVARTARFPTLPQETELGETDLLVMVPVLGAVMANASSTTGDPRLLMKTVWGTHTAVGAGFGRVLTS